MSPENDYHAETHTPHGQRGCRTTANATEGRKSHATKHQKIVSDNIDSKAKETDHHAGACQRQSFTAIAQRKAGANTGKPPGNAGQVLSDQWGQGMVNLEQTENRFHMA